MSKAAMYNSRNEISEKKPKFTTKHAKKRTNEPEVTNRNTKKKQKVNAKKHIKLIEDENRGKYTLFYRKDSPFSQHYAVKFTVDGILYNCAEQYMMHQKAITFGDEKMATAILKTDCPKQMKKFGRKVTPFDKEKWGKICQDIVKTANIAKFSQNKLAKQELLKTAGTTLAEASPRDRLWGIGLGASNPKAQDKNHWRGKNLLGYILTDVREELRKKEQEDLDCL